VLSIVGGVGLEPTNSGFLKLLFLLNLIFKTD
jgi:hypothetical protein